MSTAYAKEKLHEILDNTCAAVIAVEVEEVMGKQIGAGDGAGDFPVNIVNASSL